MYSTLFYTILALTAFAANSILCRLALAEQLIDPASFTAIRLISGAFVLAVLVALKQKRHLSLMIHPGNGNWASAFALFIYAASFSFAYQWLDTGTGALILFASVQLCMMTINLYTGHKFRLQEWLGLMFAFGGFVYLVLPGVSSPSPIGAMLMAISGIAWGVYTLHGKGSKDALNDTGGNFLRSVPLILLLVPFVINHLELELTGVGYAIASGAVASGVGYAVWYRVLPALSASLAAVCQLMVPILAALGGVLILGEDLGARLIIASVIILGGIGLVVTAKHH